MKSASKYHGFLRKKSAGIAIFWVPIFLFLIACSEKDDVLAIRELIKKGAELAEDHDVSGIMDLATEDVTAHPGQMNYQEIKGIIWRTLKYYGKLSVLYPKPAVEIYAEDRTAACNLYLLIVKKDQADPDLKEVYDDPKRWLEAVGERADLYRLKLELIKNEGKWRVRQAHLEGFKGLGFGD